MHATHAVGHTQSTYTKRQVELHRKHNPRSIQGVQSTPPHRPLNASVGMGALGLTRKTIWTSDIHAIPHAFGETYYFLAGHGLV